MDENKNKQTNKNRLKLVYTKFVYCESNSIELNRKNGSMQALITQYYITLYVDISTTKLFTLDARSCCFSDYPATDTLILLKNIICLSEDESAGNWCTVVSSSCMSTAPCVLTHLLASFLLKAGASTCLLAQP